MSTTRVFKGSAWSLFVAIMLLLFALVPLAAQEEIDQLVLPTQQDVVLDGSLAEPQGWRAVPGDFPSRVTNRYGTTQRDAHIVDQRSAAWRTGEVDARIAEVPQSMIDGIKRDPRSELPRLVTFLMCGAKDEFHKVKRLHDWITSYLSYDSDSFCGRARGSSEPYELLKLGRTVCGGFANLFNLMAQLAGIESQYISGLSRSYFDNETLSGHAWNAVRIRGVWYIVDTTHDGRRGYEYGEFGELRDYRDSWLFASPQAKLTSNLARKPEQQLVASPMDREAFLAQPFITMEVLKEGVVIDFAGLGSRFEKVRVARPDSSLFYIRDAWFPQGSPGIITMTVPAGYAVKATIKELEGSQYHQLAAVADNSELPGQTPDGPNRHTVRVLVTPPAKGAWMVVLYGSRGEPGKGQNWKTLYSFTVYQEEPVSSGLVYKPGQLYPQGGAGVYGLGALSGRAAPFRQLSSDPAWWVIDMPEPEGYELYASVSDALGKSISGAVVANWVKPGQKQFYIRPPEGVQALARIYVKKKGEERYYHVVFLALTAPGLPGQGPPTPVPTPSPGTVAASPSATPVPTFPYFPQNVAIAGSDFVGNGYSLVSGPVEEAPGLWTLTVKAPGRAMLSPNLYNETQQAVSHSVRMVPGQRANEFRISFCLPAGPGRWVFKLSRRVNTTSFTRTLQFVPIPPTASSPELASLLPMQRLYQPGELSPHPDAEPGLLQAKIEEAAGTTIAVALRWPEGYETTYSVYEGDGTRLETSLWSQLMQSSYPAPNARTFYIKEAPQTGRLMVWYIRKKGESAFPQAWVLRVPDARATAPASSPRPSGAARVWPALFEGQFTWAPVCYSGFASRGLTLLDWELGNRSAEVRFKGPANLETVTLLRTSDNRNAAGTHSVTHQNGIWTARFTWEWPQPAVSGGQPEQPIYGRVYVKAGGTSLSTLIQMPLGR